MDAVILETDVLGPASQATYADSLTSYQFPARYLRHFEALARGDDMLAIIYEPRGKPPKGRMSYVGCGVLQGAPREDASGPGNGHRVDLWIRSGALSTPSRERSTASRLNGGFATMHGGAIETVPREGGR